MTVDELIVKMNECFKPEAAAGMDATFNFALTDTEPFFVVIKEGAADIGKGQKDEPSVTITTALPTLIGVTTGSINGMQAFMTGELKAQGNMMLAQKMNALFPLVL